MAPTLSGWEASENSIATSSDSSRLSEVMRDLCVPVGSSRRRIQQLKLWQLPSLQGLGTRNEDVRYFKLSNYGCAFRTLVATRVKLGR